MRPGVNVTTLANASASTIPTDIGTGFMAGVTESGPTTLKVSDVVHNLSEYDAKWAYTGRAFAPGQRMRDSAEAFFNGGGNRLYVGRVVGPAAVKATIPIPDNAAATTLTANAKGEGSYGNDLNVQILDNTDDPTNIPVGSFQVKVKNDAGTVYETSPVYSAKADAINWSKSTSNYITLVDAASVNNPVKGSYALAGGNLDNAAIVDAQWAAGLARFTSDFGPGIVFAPGRTSDAGHVQLAQHALDMTRIAYLDGADTATASTLTASAAAVIDSTNKRSRFAALFAPWVQVPGDAGSVRTLPPSPLVAARFARNCAQGVSPNAPSAGERGILDNVLAVTQSYTDSDRQLLNDNGVNVLRDIYGVRKVYGWRTVADPINDSRWLNLGNSTMHRSVAARAGAVGERFIFREIDGGGALFASFAGALIGEVCMPLFLMGSLFGADPSEAFKVDTGPNVNTDATAAAGQLKAVMSLRMSPSGEEVDIYIVKYLVTETIPA